MSIEKAASAKRAKRITCAHPVILGNTQGITRDISASGIYFETSASQEPGNRISFTVEFDSPGGKLLLKCNGEIVRIDPSDGKVGVAVKILDSVLAPVPANH